MRGFAALGVDSGCSMRNGADRCGGPFKLTDIALPAGTTYTSDADGFLSQFTPSAVSEPSTSALLLAGAAVLAWRRRSIATAPA